jgi:hypothetical protein
MISEAGNSTTSETTQAAEKPCYRDRRKPLRSSPAALSSPDGMRLELLSSMTDHLEIFSRNIFECGRSAAPRLVVIISDADITKI